jgi:hypothetical protein
MPDKLIGVAVRGNKANEVLAMIEQAEQLGIHAAWMTTGGARLDSITVFAAAALRTQRIKLAPLLSRPIRAIHWSWCNRRRSWRNWRQGVSASALARVIAPVWRRWV